ncbi:leucyl-cystinyl aminopeptidase [Anguilla anguilla]|uniref:leucyl-cystinyl aminopeptidase n=1 Tax=Anguilla anguilla TaxID=7936 RepID=UPI0015A92A8A|nr:leucyl-cystinyl aminopeptidase [Anguilla anguilla]
MESFQNDRASLPRNMIENSMFEEEPDVVDLAKDTPVYPLDPEDVAYEPRSSRLLVRGLGENDLDEEEEDYESSARLLGMSFMNRSANLRGNNSPYVRQDLSGSCSMPSARTLVVGVFVLVLVASVAMVIYFLPKCTFTKEGCHKGNATMELIYPISTNGELFPWTELRLPAKVRPVHYDLLIHPNLTDMTFQGKVSITVEIAEDTKTVVLHAADMKVTRAMFQDKEIKILEYKPWQQIAIKLPEDLKKGKSYVLTLEYDANLSTSYDGFYNSSYNDKTGATRVLAATQFEPLGARKAFPCFDEPAFKATFLIKIKRDPGYISLSNMPRNKTTKLPDGLFQDEFEKSVIMSTYLVAFVVANETQFTSTSTNVSGTLVSVYSVQEKDQIKYALETGAKLLDFYNTFFGIKYPLNKLDLVAIPDFLAGAMENWGLITFRETTLLVVNESSILDRQLVTSVIAHELAHQWFGNLVTMKWWNDLWLNEGFATYMQYTSITKVFPDLKIGDEFLSTRFRAQASDALNSSHPVSTAVTTPEQVEEMFDSVSYEKGASILHMLNSVLSEDKFRKGIIAYLNTYNSKNAGSEDLWNSLSQVAGQSFSVAEMMKTWTQQKGFPLVTVRRNGTRVRLTQEHFLLTPDPTNSTATPVSDALWHIPLTYVNDSCSLDPGCKQVMFLTEKTMTLDIPEGVAWLKFNFKNEGFYIVHYAEGWRELTDALKGKPAVLTPEDRASLINNIFALSRLGKVSFRQVINLLGYIRKETETAPVMEALLQLDHIYRLLEKKQDLPLIARMQVFIFNHFGELMDSQVWEEGASISQENLRSSLLELACNYNRENCTENAKRIFDKWVASNRTERIPGDLRRVVYSVGAQTEPGWLTLLEAYRYSRVEAEKRKILQALASSQAVMHIVWLMKAALEGSLVQTQELPIIIDTICRNFPGHLYAWDFVKENWDEITKKFPLGSFSLQRIITSTTSQFSSKAHLLEVQNFFGSLKEKGAQLRSVREATETIKLNMRWMDDNRETLWLWL